MSLFVKTFKLKTYLIICGIYVWSLMLIPLFLYRLKYFFQFKQLCLYAFSSFIELFFIFLSCYILFQLIKNIKFSKYLYSLIFIILFALYFIQGITFYILGNFLPILAIENLHEYKYYFNNLNLLIFILSTILLFINISLLYISKNIKTKDTFNIKIFIILVLSACILCLPTIRRHSPAFSLLTNCLRVFVFNNNFKLTNKQIENFLKNEQIKNKEYPFLKDTVYNNDKHFIQEIESPNVIIIFMEGISTKFISCYENNFFNITPNIDKFANNENVCKFDNYYNHTASTFRGIIGTLSSAYPYHGGYEEGIGWAESDNSERYKQTKYSSLPKLLANIGYNSIMFSPHIDKSAFSNMIKMLGFKELYFAQKNCEELLNSYEYFNEYLLSDKGIFLSLKEYLRKYEKDTEPKFICLYNIGTHALKNVNENGKKYEDGNNQILNRIHNLDYEIGEFLNYFYNSPYAKNTYLIITTDHCTYYEPAYKELFNNEPIYCFIDKIPLLIYNPFKTLPKNIDTNFRSSLDFAPTLLNLLNRKNIQNSFLGHSLFDLDPYNVNIGIYADCSSSIIVQIKGMRYFIKDVPNKYYTEAEEYLKLIKIYQYYEQKNKLFPE